MPVLSKRALAAPAISIIFLTAALIVGCAAPAEHPALDRAGAAVERARSAPRVRALAAAELDRAEVALEYARTAARAGAPPDQVEHLAYVVSQRAALAQARAAERVARSELDKLQRALDQGVAEGPREQDQRTRTRLTDNQRAPAQLHEDANSQVRLERDRQGRTSSARQDDVGAAPAVDQRERAPAEEDAQEQASLRRNQRERASVQQDQQARAPLHENQPTRAPLDGDGSTRGLGDLPLAPDWQVLASSAPGQRQARAALEQEQREHGAVQEDQRARAPLEQERQARPSAREAQQIRTAAADNGAALVETVPPDITLSLAQLSFEWAEPTDDTLEQLAALAERLLREPGPSVSIEVDFELPDPEARTVMEQRVEVVRAILLQRGIAPARLVVRAAEDGAVEPSATSSFVESPD